MNKDEIRRLQAKTPEQHFLRVLEQEFHYAPKVAQAVLEEAQACLAGRPGQIKAGQMRVILSKYEAGHGRALCDTATTEAVWTVDAGREDRQVLQRHSRQGLRRVRIQRLLSEALEQGAAATQEDLAQALHVSVRTIKRDCAALQAQGVYLPTRGNLRGIGRGQTHKAQIVGRWLEGETYDQIALYTHHSLTCIQRYIQTFVRVVALHRQEFSEGQIALLVSKGRPLVREYLAVYGQHDTPACRERLAAQLQRLNGASENTQEPQKGGR
jgi:CRP-like cAMP-binding protein